jgi:hypothetical protein
MASLVPILGDTFGSGICGPGLRSAEAYACLLPHIQLVLAFLVLGTEEMYARCFDDSLAQQLIWAVIQPTSLPSPRRL